MLLMIRIQVLLLIFCLTSNDLLAGTPAVSLRNRFLLTSLKKFRYKQELLHHAQVAGPAVRMIDQKSETLQPKSKGRGFLQSLVLPGWGQHYAESRTMMKVFIATEVVLWGAFFGFKASANRMQDNYRTLAATHAGVQPQGKPDRYFFDLGIYEDLYENNQAKLRDRDLRGLYPETAEYFWRWDDRENRLRFDQLRIDSDTAENRAQLTLAFIVANHLISAIHSTLAVHRFNESLLKKGLGLHIDIDTLDPDRRVVVGLSMAF
jgi:hypothetical protein